MESTCFFFAKHGKGSFGGGSCSFSDLEETVSILSGRASGLLLENPAEVQGIVISYDGSNFIYIVIRALQKILSCGNPDGGNVLNRGHPGKLLKGTNEPACADMKGGCISFNTDRGVKMFIKEVCGLFHFLLNLTVGVGNIQKLSVNKEKNLLKEKGEQFLKAGPADLKLLNHLTKKLRVFGGGSCVKRVSKESNLVMLQNFLYLTPCKMNPVNLCLIPGRKAVTLRLSGTVQNHLPCRENLFLLVKEKMRLSGSQIEKLIILSSMGPQGMNGRLCAQMISAAAFHD